MSQYIPVPPNSEDPAAYAFAELQDLARSLEEAKESVPFQILNAAPAKPRDGMIVHADGTNWDPGSGAGPYSYIAGTWTPLHTGGAGGGQSSIQFKDEGSNLGTVGTVTSVDFVGAGVTATRVTNALTVTISGGGLSDGDKGDITVGGSGTTLTIDNDAVTYAKMQNVSAASKLLGRGDASAGDVQELTLGTNMAMSGTTVNVGSGAFGSAAYVNTSTFAANIHDHDGSDITSGTVVASFLPTLDAISAPVASVNFADQQATSFRIENRTSDPGTPTTGQIWLRTDL